MNTLIFSKPVFSILLLSAAVSFAEDDLDAALEARKKRAPRRVYSERIQLEDRNIVIPKTRSEEELALDRDLEKLENQLARQDLPSPGFGVPRPSPAAPVQPKNWLTPSLLESESDDNASPGKDDTSWIHQELDRQKEIEARKKALAEDEALVNRMLRENSRQNIPTENSPFKRYEPVLRNTIYPEVTPSPSTVGSLRPFEIAPPKESKMPSRITSPFKPSVRANSGVIKSSFSSSPSSSPSSSRRPEWQAPLGSSPQSTVSDFTTGWKTTKPVSLSPLQKVRQASPIHKKDPFDDTFSTKFSTSIWD